MSSGSSAPATSVVAMRSGSVRRAVTLVELLVIVATIAALAAMTLPAIGYAQRRARANGTSELILAVGAAIASYPQRQVSVPARGERSLKDGAVRRLWDFDQDGILDGDPAKDPGFAELDRTAAGHVAYRGFLASTGVAVPGRHVDAEGRVVDAWRRPLRIAFAADAYGSTGFGIWSDGPDGIEGNDDDLRSWDP